MLTHSACRSNLPQTFQPTAVTSAATWIGRNCFRKACCSLDLPHSMFQRRIICRLMSKPRNRHSGHIHRYAATRNYLPNCLILLSQLHSCFVCNVVAAVSALTEDRESRFVQRGSIPPVYLSCTMNYILNDDASENGGSALCPRIETYEPAIATQQELCIEEAEKFEEVNWCLHPRFGCDWLGYFNHYFVLDQFFELWRGDVFVGTSKSRPRTSRNRLECYPCYSLQRSSFSDFENHSKNFFGGCVVLFRHLVQHSQLFGIWFLWLRIEGRLLIVDLQNSTISASLQEAVTSLKWGSLPMPDVFFAPFKNDIFGLSDRKLPKKPRSNFSDAPNIKCKVTKSN